MGSPGMDGRRVLGSWLEGPAAAARAEGVDLGEPGARIGRPPAGRGSVVGWGGRIAAFVLDAVPCALIAHALLGDPGWSTPVFLAEVLLLTWLAGASFGQRLLGMRVERVDGGRAALWQVLVRTALLALLVPAVVTDRDRRGLHDKAAGTVLARR